MNPRTHSLSIGSLAHKQDDYSHSVSIVCPLNYLQTPMLIYQVWIFCCFHLYVYLDSVFFFTPPRHIKVAESKSKAVSVPEPETPFSLF